MLALLFSPFCHNIGKGIFMAFSGYANKKIDKLIDIRKTHMDLQKSIVTAHDRDKMVMNFWSLKSILQRREEP